MVRTNELGQRRSHAEDRATVERLSVDPRFLHVSWRFQVGVDEPPVALPVQEVVVCYQLQSPSSFISQVRLVEMTTPNVAHVRHDDPTDLKSTDSGFLHQRDRRVRAGRRSDPGAAAELPIGS